MYMNEIKDISMYLKYKLYSIGKIQNDDINGTDERKSNEESHDNFDW